MSGSMKKMLAMGAKSATIYIVAEWRLVPLICVKI